LWRGAVSTLPPEEKNITSCNCWDHITYFKGERVVLSVNKYEVTKKKKDTKIKEERTRFQHCGGRRRTCFTNGMSNLNGGEEREGKLF